jgi:hypothetical protein
MLQRYENLHIWIKVDLQIYIHTNKVKKIYNKTAERRPTRAVILPSQELFTTKSLKDALYELYWRKVETIFSVYAK